MGVDWQLSGKPGVPDVELQIAMRQLERSRLRQERFCLSFWLSCAHPLGLRSSAWLIALATPASFRFTSPDRLGPFPSSSRCCPPDISSVLADHDEFFELPAPRGGGSPIQGFDHCYAGSCSQAGIPAWAPPCFCRSCPRRQNSW